MLCARRNTAQILSNGPLKTFGVDVAQGRYFFKAAIRTVIFVLFLAALVNRGDVSITTYCDKDLDLLACIFLFFFLKGSEGGR